MIRAAFFLTTRGLKNRVLRSLTRLRQPRYAVGGLAAIAYFWMLLFRRHAVTTTFARAEPVAVLTIGISVLVLIMIIGVWALPGDTPGLVFSEAEIQFLFPAPLSRRNLLAYKTLRKQVQGLFSAIIFTLFVFRGGNFLGIWLAFAAFDIYARFASFARARLRLAGIGWMWRVLAVVGALSACGMVAYRQIVYSPLGAQVADVRSWKDSAPLIGKLTAVIWHPPLGSILALPRVVAAAIYAPTLPAMAVSWLVLAALAAALFMLTTRLDVSFEDASIVASQRALARRTRMRASRFGTGSAAVNRFPPPFRLAEQGRPEVAVVWKNLIGALRMSSFPILALSAPLVLAALASIFRTRAGPELMVIFATFGFASVAMFAIAGPQALRADLRVDILRIDVIKTFPMSAESLLAAELAAPLVLIAAAEFLLLGVSFGILNLAAHPIPFLSSPEFVITAFVLIVPLCAIQLLIQNAAVILVPAWAGVGGDSGGFSFLGQRLLLLLANVFTLGITLIPAAIVFFPALFLTRWIFGDAPAGVLLAAVAAAAVLVVEIAIAHRLLAAQFEDIDPGNDLDQSSGG